MEGKRAVGRLRRMMLDWIMTDGYWKLRGEAQQRVEEWRRRHRTFEPT